MGYNWQHRDWPEFTSDLSDVEARLFAFMEAAGKVEGQLSTLPEGVRSETLIDIMVAEAMKTSEIEGEYLSRRDVLSSIKTGLGLHPDSVAGSDLRAKGISELMIAVREDFGENLTEDQLFDWHRMIMKGDSRVKAGAWRTYTEPMRVVSGSIGRETIHFEAPPSEAVPKEMRRFISWFNETGPGGQIEIKKPLIRSAIAHLYFESIHPFEDGNGRMGRAISEKALSQRLGRPVLLSLSQSIEANLKDYYDALEEAQGGLELTKWIGWFVEMALDAQSRVEEQIGFTIKKTTFFDRNGARLNARQLKAIQKMLDAGPSGFEGGMTARKYIAITKSSKATATRDLQDLAAKSVLKPIGAGSKHRYELMLG